MVLRIRPVNPRSRVKAGMTGYREMPNIGLNFAALRSLFKLNILERGKK